MTVFDQELVSGPGYHLYLRNDAASPITITEILFTVCRNVAGECALRHEPFVLEPGDLRRVYTVQPADPTQPYRYRWTYRMSVGRMAGVLDADSDTPPPIVVHEEPGLTMLLDPRGTWVNVVIPGSSPDESMEFMQRVTRAFYGVFQDDFDIALVSFPDGEQPPTASGRAFNAQTVPGIGPPYPDRTSDFGSSGRLLAGLYLAQHRFLDSPIALHEIGHIWGQWILPGEEAHWGFAGVGGLLGGWEPGTLEEVGNGTWLARGPDGSPGFRLFGPTRDGLDHRLKPYAPLELYLMGVLPADSVPPFRVADNAEWVTETAGVFRADGIRTVTIEEIIQTVGERVPAPEAGRELRGVYIVVSPEPLADGVRDLIHDDVIEFARPGPRTARRSYFNFWEATGGRASLVMDGLASALRDSSVLDGNGG